MATGSNDVVIVAHDEAWAAEFLGFGRRIRDAVGNLAARIDHIGSTSVSGLAAKDIIDIQLTVDDEASLDVVADRLVAGGWRMTPWREDHVVPRMDAAPSNWVKRLLQPPEGERRVNLHVRVAGRPNQRYALLFRDYLRNHAATADAYAEAKRRLSAVADRAVYAETKDPIVDLIYLPAEEWATRTGWTPGPSDM